MRLLMPFSHPVPLLLVVLLLAAIHGTFAAPLGEYFSPADADAYVEAALRTLGDSEADVTSKDYAVRLLKALDHASAATGYKSSACAAVSSVLASGDLAGIHHGLSLRDGVGCTGGIPLEARGAIEAAIQKDDLWSLYYGTLSAPLLDMEVDAGAVLNKVWGLMLGDGSIRSEPKGATADGNVIMAAEIVAELAPMVKGGAVSTAQRVVDVMKEKNLAAEPGLLVPLNAALGEMVPIKPTKLKSMARDLLEASRTSRPGRMLRVYEALTSIAGYAKAPFPIKLLPTSPSVEELASGKVRFLVSSLLGEPVPVQSASLSRLARADGSDALGTDNGSPLGKPDADGFRALPAVEVAAGLYTAEFAVELVGAEAGKALTAKLPVAVSSTARLAEARLVVSEGRSAAASSSDLSAAIANYVLAPGDKLPDTAQASTMEGHHLHVGFSLKGAAAAAPHQAFVRFTHSLTGLDTFFVAAPDRTGGGGGGAIGRFSVSVALGEETGTFLQRSGRYDVAIIVGGPLVAPPILENLGAIDLDFPVAKERDWPIYARSLLHESDVTLGPLPEKHHTFREPEARPPVGVSLLFTLFVLAPLAGLVYGLRQGGADFKRLPKGGTGRMWCLAYQACMVSIVVLFVTYWSMLTMAYTLQVLAVLSLVTTCTGRKAFQALAVQEESGRGGVHAKVE